MTAWRYACALCGLHHTEAHTDYCMGCGGPVLAERTFPFSGRELRAPGIWKYAADLPLPSGTDWLSLGEGGTPVLESQRLANRAGVRRVALKLEYLAPTGSFKDRAVAGGVAHAVTHGAKGIVCASSGNAAASAAAYAARAGLPATIVVPESVPPGKLAAAAAYNAIPLAVPGDYSNSFAVARELCHELGLTNVTTTYVNPHSVAALRTVAYELAEQLPEGVDWVTIPVGAGPLLYGVAAGFAELVSTNRWARAPRLLAVQPSGCAPIARDWRAGNQTVTAWPRVDTAVSGISDPLRGYPGDGTVTLARIRATQGMAIALADREIDAARADLAHEDGLLVESAAAAAVAALESLAGEGWLAADDTVACLLTGHGLKTLTAPPVEPTLVTSVADAKIAIEKQGAHVG